MAEAPTNATIAAIEQHLRARHREYTKQLDGLDEAGLNWRPAADTNSIFEILTHALDTERELVSSAAGSRVEPENHFGVRGTVAQATDRLSRAGQDLDEHLPKVDDVSLEIEVFRRQRTIASALTLAVSHAAEHVGHIQLTR